MQTLCMMHNKIFLELLWKRLDLKRIKAEREEQAEKQANAATPQPQTQPPPPQKPDPRAEKWAQENEWFGQDQTMTYAAFGVHKQLIEQEGFDPNTEEYYTELDNRIRSEFPHKFKDNEKIWLLELPLWDNGFKVSIKGRRTVKLTPSQIAIAKRLGVPLRRICKACEGVRLWL